MIINIKNITSHPQEVMFCDGSGKTILPGQALDIEEGRVYKEELVRIKRFFKATFPERQPHKRDVKIFSKEKSHVREVKTLPPKNNDGGIV